MTNAGTQEAQVKKTGFTTWTQREEINWYHTGLLVITPLIALYGLLTTKPHPYSIILGLVMYLWCGLGVTAGYHRLWSHKAYSATWAVRLFLCLGGAAAIEGSAKWWCRNHRAHHRYTDTDKDPYNARRGFWYAHCGWLLVKQNAKQIGHVDITDLQKDPMIVWQHKYYVPIVLVTSFILPCGIATLWGDFWGAYFYSTMLRVVFNHHATFCVNSLAHYFGDKNFSDYHTAFDSFITALLTLGEGYHNYHHEFPQDYRNGIRFFHYDPTKWFIGLLSYFGLTYDLKTISDAEVAKARLQMEQHQLDTERVRMISKYKCLPAWSWAEIARRVADGEALIAIDGQVYDVKRFVHEHPGGRQTLLNQVGRDCSKLFAGLAASDKPAHVHSKYAVQYMDNLVVAVLA